MQKMAELVRSFMLLSVIAGICILLSSIYATRQSRIEESVYYKITGATRQFIRNIFISEHLFLGCFSFLVACIVSQVGTFFVCRYRLNIDYSAQPGFTAMVFLVHLALVVLLSIVPLNAIILKRPAEYLRENFDE